MKFPKLKRGAELRLALTELDGITRDGTNGGLKDAVNIQLVDGKFTVRPSLKFKSTAESISEPDNCYSADGTTVIATRNIRFKLAYFDDNGDLLGEVDEKIVAKYNGVLIIDCDKNGYQSSRLYYNENDGEVGDVTMTGLLDNKNAERGFDKSSASDAAYIPTVSVGGRGYAAQYDDFKVHFDHNGTEYESKNLLSDTYRVKQTSEYLKNVYVLPYPINENTTVKSSYVDNYYNDCHHDFKTDQSGQVTETSKSGSYDELELLMHFDSRNALCFFFTGSDDYEPIASPLGSSKYNNFVIDVTYGEVRSPIGRCRKSAIYRSDDCTTYIVYDHLIERSTLWLSGNSDNTYFPECGKYDIGNANEAITAVCQVDDKVAVLKAASLWLMEISNGEQMTEDELAADYIRKCGKTVEAKIMPIADIGCDCPNTAVSCDGRLVWLNSEGKLYMMTAVENPDARCVKELSHLIEPRLGKYTAGQLKKASAVHKDGKYYLLVQNEIFVLDCRTNAMDNYTAYADDLTAQKKLIFYCWDISANGVDWKWISDGRVPLLYGIRDGKLICCTLDGDDGVDCIDGETEVPISWKAETGLYDLGRADVFKRSCRVSAHISAENRSTATVFNENGCEGCNEIAAGDTSFATVNAADRSLLLGAKFEGRGKAYISDITLWATETTHRM